MNSRTRHILFYSFVIVFFIISAAVIVYSLGWRFSFQSYKFEKVGGVYIKTQPRDVAIKIGEKTYPDLSNVIQSGTLVSNLSPKNYKISIEKNGYFPYYKNLQIKPSMVEEIFATLIPTDIKSENIANIKGNKFIAATENADKIIFQNNSTKTYYLYNQQNTSSTLNLNTVISNIKKTEIAGIDFVPFQTTQFIVDDANDGIKLFDTDKQTYSYLVKSSVNIWTIKNSNIYYIKQIDPKTKQLGFYAFNLIFKNESLIKEIPLETSKIIIEKIDATNNFIAFSNKNDELFLFDKNKDSFVKIGEKIKTFSFSPDTKKLAYLENDGTIKILFLDQTDYTIRKKAGDKIQFNLENKDTIENISWYKDSFHLFVKFVNKTSFMEIDDRSPLNIYPILNNPDPFYYNSKNDILYFINNNSLMSINFSNF